MIIDDAWAESELEKQLRSLTPIQSVEDAEKKLTQLTHDCDFNDNTELISEEEEEETLPESAQIFLSLIQHVTNQVEGQLNECEKLISEKIELTVNPGEEKEEPHEEEEIDNISEVDNDEIPAFDINISNISNISNSSTVSQDNTSDSDHAKELSNLTRSYYLRVQTELPIYQIPDQKEQIRSLSNGLYESEREAQRLEREKERNERLETEKRRLDLLQQEELKKIEEEMQLAEEALRKEILEHERKVKQMTEQHAREWKEHEEEKRKQEEEMLRRKNAAATKIQAHFKGMRTRSEHGKALEQKIKQKRKELFEEKLRYYEEVIRQEKAAVDAELEQRRKEEIEKKKEEARAEEIRLRHLEKERTRKEEQERIKLQLEEQEKRKKKEEEERLRLQNEQKLHWLQNERSSSNEQEISASLKASHSSNKTKELINDNAQPKTNANIQKTNLNEAAKIDNYNVHQTDIIDNTELPKTPSTENDNSGKTKPSFFGSIASKAKNLFRTSSASNEIFQTTQTASEVATKEVINIGYSLLEKVIKESDLKKEQIEPETDEYLNSKPICTDDDESSILPISKLTNSDVLSDGIAKSSKLNEGSLVKPGMSIDISVTPNPIEQSTAFHAADTADLNLSTREVEESNSVTTISEPSPSSPLKNRVSLPPGVDSPAVSVSSNKRVRRLESNLLKLSLDSSLSPAPSQICLTTSVDLSRPSQSAAKAEYRRKRKLRDDLKLARELSDVSTKNSSSSKPVDSLDWDLFLSSFEDNYKHWNSSNLLWSEIPPRPRTAGSGRSISKNYLKVHGHVINDTTLIENHQTAAIHNPPCSEIYIKNCSSMEITIDHTQDRVKSLSLEHCHDTEIFINDSSVLYLNQSNCEMSKLPKVPVSLLVLTVNDNLISRINPLNCSNLVVVNLSHNQLVSTRGLQYLPNLITLDLSYNVLSNVQHLEKCGLLQLLNLSHNQLVNIPSFSNNILLTSLDLSDNGLTNIDNFSCCWLPCLQSLKLADNGLCWLPQLYRICPLVKCLDISRNMISDTATFVESLQFCRLEEVYCDNVDLGAVNGFIETMKSSTHKASTLTDYFASLQNSLGELDLANTRLAERASYLQHRHVEAKLIRSQIPDILNIPEETAKCSVDPPAKRDVTMTTRDVTMATRDVTMTTRDLANSSRDKTTESVQEMLAAGNSSTFNNNVIGRAASVECTSQKKIEDHTLKKNEDYPLVKKEDYTLVKEDYSLNNEDCTPASVHHDGNYSSQNGVGTATGGVEHVTLHTAAAEGVDLQESVRILQSLIRGFRSRLRFRNLCAQRRQAMYQTYHRMDAAACKIQRLWRGYSVRKMLWSWLPWLQRRKANVALQNKAACRIQSVYRGYMLRRRLLEVLQQVTYDLSDVEFDEVGSLNWDEDECERGWGLPPTPSLQHNTPLPSSRSSSRTISTASSACFKPARSHFSQGPVPLLPLDRIRSRECSRANSMRSLSDISVLSLPPSRRTSQPPSRTPNRAPTKTPKRAPTSSKRHAAIAAEWGVKNHETVQKLLQRSRKFGKQMSPRRKRELIRKKILESSRKIAMERSPPPPTADNLSLAGSDTECVEYQWDVPPIRQQWDTPPSGRSPGNQVLHNQVLHKRVLHNQVYRNPRFSQPSSNVKLPPLVRKPDRPKYAAFK